MRTLRPLVALLLVFPLSAQVTRLGEQDAFAAFKAEIERAAGADQFSGAAVVARNGQ